MSSGIAELEPRPSLASSQQRINIPLPTVISTHSNASYHDNSNIYPPTESPFSFGLKKSRWFFDRMLGRANDPPRSHASFPSHHRAKSLNPNAFLSGIPTKIVSSSSSSTSHRRSISAASIREPHVEYTSNNLTKTERAEKVRRNRKVLQILGDGLLKRGTGPTGDIAFDQALNTVTNPQSHSPLSPSVFDENFVLHKRPSQLLVENRRHSSPVTSGFSPDILIDHHLLRRPQLDSQKYIHPVASHHPVSTETEVATPKPKKEEHLNDQYEQSTSIRSGTPTLAESNPSLHSTDSFTEGGHSAFLGDATPEQLEEKGRARKRATLAKLHRFLGSRVPADLVLGFTQSEVEASLPPMESTPTSAESNSSGMARAKSLKSLGSQRLRRKRSPGDGSVGRRVDMGEQDADEMNHISYMSDGGLDVRFGMLTDAERNRIVRKRKKITKMMGDCPLDILTQQSSPFPPKRDEKDLTPLSQEAGKSSQYMQHRYSLDSLTYLMQNENQDQLQDFVTYMRSEGDSTSGQRTTEVSHPPAPTADSLVPPSPTESWMSESTQYPTSTTEEREKAEAFQQRRRRAAKLTSFFGVEYRELFTEVLDSIEDEVKSDAKRGSLTAEEVRELLVKLRQLKTR